MRTVLLGSVILFLIGSIVLFNGCSKEHGSESQPPVITPTVNPIPYSVLVYLVTPSDKKIDYNYYNAAKTTIQKLQGWCKTQMGNNKTFVLNPVVVDTLTGLHPSSWYGDDNGSEISGSSFHAYNNVKYEMKQLLGTKFDTTLYTYFVYIPSDFPDETIPRGLAVEGLNNLDGLVDNSNFFIGMDAHSLAHAFGLPEPAVQTSDGIMSAAGISKYPNCILEPVTKDSLNASPFFQVH